MKRNYLTINNIILSAVLLLAAALFLHIPAATFALAGDVEVKAELNATEFPVDQAVLLTVSVNGARSAEPTMPDADGLQFAYRGQNSQAQWINGKSSSSISFVFMVQAEKAGTYTIKPIKVTVDGKTYTTDPLSCTVLPASASSSPPANRQQLKSRQPKAPAARLRSGESEKIGFMRIIPEQDKIYSGQIVPFTIKAFFRQGMRVTLKSNPRFIGENFILQSIDEKPMQREEPVNGESYTSLTWKGTLSAVKEGTFPLEVEMDADLLVRTQRQRRAPQLGSPFFNDPFFDDFFAQYSRRDVKVSSPAKDIVVMDLPSQGRPDDFHGAIGTFSLAVAASPLKGKVGDPITLKMMVSGTGNFDMVHAPEITDKNGWKTYPATDSFEEQSRNSGKKTFEQAIVPTSASLTAIPPIRFSYFDPEAGEYISLVSDPVDIQLEQPAGVPATISSPVNKTNNSEPTAGRDLQQQNNLTPLHTDPGRMVQELKPLYKKSWFLFLMTAALLCLITILVLYLRRRKLAADPGILVHKQVNRQIRQHLQAMEKAVTDHDQDSFCSHCRAAIQLRFGELWRTEAQAITLADLQQRLAVDAPLLDVFAKIEHAGYSGEQLDQSTLNAMLQTTRQELDTTP
jgi:hypothetical protein